MINQLQILEDSSIRFFLIPMKSLLCKTTQESSTYEFVDIIRNSNGLNFERLLRNINQCAFHESYFCVLFCQNTFGDQ